MISPVVVGNGGVEALGIVTADGVVDDESGVLGGRGLGRNSGHHAARYPLGLVGSYSELRRFGQLRAHDLFHLGAGQPGIPGVAACGQEDENENG